MKTFLSIILVLTVAVSCKRYEDGPAISLLQKKARLANTWKVEKYMRGGTDETSQFNNLYPNYQLIIDNTGVYSYLADNYTSVPVEITGKWAFTDSRKVFIRMTPDDSTLTFQTWEILRLTNTELWITYDDASLHPVEMHFIPKD